MAVPLFSAAIVLPATLNIVTPGSPVLVLWHSAGYAIGPWRLPDYLAVTAPGLYLAVRFVLRIAVCITLTLLLTVTTRSENLFRGLRGVGVPRLFVMLLGMMQRYLVLLLRVAEEIHLAKRSRSITAGSLREEQAWVGAGVGTLFRRTQALGDDIYLAMLSRGYTGEVHLLDDPRLCAIDFAFLAACLSLAVLMLVLR
jgi:cobalt/nickel transport system permease protein